MMSARISHHIPPPVASSRRVHRPPCSPSSTYPLGYACGRLRVWPRPRRDAAHWAATRYMRLWAPIPAPLAATTAARPTLMTAGTMAMRSACHQIPGACPPYEPLSRRYGDSSNVGQTVKRVPEMQAGTAVRAAVPAATAAVTITGAGREGVPADRGSTARGKSS
jgi:hypothetical protein